MTSQLQLENDVQSIKSGVDVDYSTYAITSKDVVVQCNSGKHNHGSSKVKLMNRIDYNWELKYYYGQLVAVHMEGKVVAYAMKGKDGGMVRVVNQQTDQRALIKNLKTDVRDVSFAFLRTEIILGCVDDVGNVLIYEIDDQPNLITCNLLLHIYHPNSVNSHASSPSNYKLVWCPYLPSIDDDPENGDETAKMFVFVNGSKAEVWDLCAITAKYNEGPVEPDEDHEGYVEIDHSLHLVDVSFSSDGTAIATACSDGYVKFYQIYTGDNDKQKCLHEWKPHDGKPLSCLIFIDNILEYSSDSRFWKFAITGSNYNSELKLWSCETWTCLQTIQFKVDPSSLIGNLFFKIRIDYTGQYVVMSEINNKILYVLQIKRNDAEKLVAVTSISQFLLPSPFLSFHITEVEVGKMPFASNNSDEFYDDELEDVMFDEESPANSISLSMLVIQPKKFQDCKIVFSPELPTNREAEKYDDVEEKPTNDETVPKLDDLQSSVTLLIQQQTNKSQINLMTPEDFTTSAHNSRPASVQKSAEKLAKEENAIDFQRPQKDNFASGGSSPSREVQEILSLNNSTYSNQDFFDNITKLPEGEPNGNQLDNLFIDNNAGEMVWPKIPVVKNNEIVKENDSNPETADSDRIQNNFLALNLRVASLERAIQQQTILLGKITDDVKTASLNNSSTSVHEEITKDIDLVMSKYQLQHAKLLENLLNMQKNKEREHQEALVSSITQILNKSISEKIQQVVSQEVKHAVVPAVVNMLESLKHQLDVQYSQKLNSTDHLLRENIAKLVTSKSVTDSLSKSVVSIIAPSLEKCYKDMIATSLIPTWERVCSNMFQQINDTFTQGTKEYTASVEHYMDRQKKVQEKSRDLISQIATVSDTLKSSTDKLTNMLSTEIQKQFNQSFKSMQDKLSHNLKDVITEEVNSNFKSHAAVIENSVLSAVRSRSVTPASQIDSQIKFTKIQHCLSAGSYEEALQIALSAENLLYVVYVCERVEATKFFGGSCRLPQSCLLALIQQLSMDLNQNTETKLSYLNGALLCLNRNDPDTRRFFHKVLTDLAVQLSNYVSSNPPYKLKSDAKILSIAVESMTNSLAI